MSELRNTGLEGEVRPVDCQLFQSVPIDDLGGLLDPYDIIPSRSYRPIPIFSAEKSVYLVQNYFSVTKKLDHSKKVMMLVSQIAKKNIYLRIEIKNSLQTFLSMKITSCVSKFKETKRVQGVLALSYL